MEGMIKRMEQLLTLQCDVCKDPFNGPTKTEQMIQHLERNPTHHIIEINGNSYQLFKVCSDVVSKGFNPGCKSPCCVGYELARLERALEEEEFRSKSYREWLTDVFAQKIG